MTQLVKLTQSDREVNQLPPLIHPPLWPTLTHQVTHSHESERKGQRECVCVQWVEVPEVQ